jgi:hypothetical protein
METFRERKKRDSSREEEERERREKEGEREKRERRRERERAMCITGPTQGVCLSEWDWRVCRSGEIGIVSVHCRSISIA